jgi:hypothetical protein
VKPRKDAPLEKQKTYRNRKTHERIVQETLPETARRAKPRLAPYDRSERKNKEWGCVNYEDMED